MRNNSGVFRNSEENLEQIPHFAMYSEGKSYMTRLMKADKQCSYIFKVKKVFLPYPCCRSSLPMKEKKQNSFLILHIKLSKNTVNTFNLLSIHDYSFKLL